MIEWAAFALSLAGNYLNIKKSVWGFVLWIVGNTIWVVVDYQQQKWANMTLFLIYTLMSIWGIYQWTRPNNVGKTKEQGEK